MKNHIPPARYKYLEAEILKNKLFVFLVGGKINVDNNFDVTSYQEALDPNLIEESISLIETYIKRNVYKYSGISYTEFKNMTRLEQYILLLFLKLVAEEEHIVNELTDKSLGDLDKKLEQESHELVLPGFNLNANEI